MTDDAELLSRYAEARSEAAFAEIVERHLGMVYHSAMRQLGGDAHRANDVAQSVFILLAEKANQLCGHPSLAGWLHTATRFKSIRVLRESSRRRSREEEALIMNDPHRDAAHDEEWAKLRPVIDEVLTELPSEDREAVLLRFFEGKSFTEIGERLRLTEKSAHKRVERALEKTRARLTRRGIFSTTALAAVLGTHAAPAAPAGLSATVASAVSASSVIVSTAPLWGFWSFMASTKMIVSAGAVAAVFVGSLFIHSFQASRETAERVKAVNGENEAAIAQLSALNARAAQGKADRDKLEGELAARTTTPLATRPQATPTGPTDGSALMEIYPQLRETLVAYWRESILSKRGNDFRALGLTGEQTQKVIAIEMRRRARMIGMHQFALQWPLLARREYKEEMRAVIGRPAFERYDKLDQQRDEAPNVSAAVGAGKNIAKEVATAVYFTPTPLSAAQAEQLSRIVPANGVDDMGRLSEQGWNAVLAYAETAFTAEQKAVLNAKHDQWLGDEAYTRARRTWWESEKAAKAAK
jgi:RNA polymerase sigma factor (sigma-70 family)